jgi:hypothetical protein
VQLDQINHAALVQARDYLALLIGKNAHSLDLSIKPGFQHGRRSFVNLAAAWGKHKPDIIRERVIDSLYVLNTA